MLWPRGPLPINITRQLSLSVFMMRNAFDAVWEEVQETARIDGVDNLQLLALGLMSRVMPGVATGSIFAFLNALERLSGGARAAVR